MKSWRECLSPSLIEKEMLVEKVRIANFWSPPGFEPRSHCAMGINYDKQAHHTTVWCWSPLCIIFFGAHFFQFLNKLRNGSDSLKLHTKWKIELNNLGPNNFAFLCKYSQKLSLLHYYVYLKQPLSYSDLKYRKKKKKKCDEVFKQVCLHLKFRR